MKDEAHKQRAKIINMFKDGEWHCINDIRAIYIFSFHKRRVEIEGRENLSELPTGKYIFEERKCEHGTKNQKDFKMFLNTRLFKEVKYFVPELNREIIKYERVAVLQAN